MPKNSSLLIRVKTLVTWFANDNKELNDDLELLNRNMAILEAIENLIHWNTFQNKPMSEIISFLMHEGVPDDWYRYVTSVQDKTVLQRIRRGWNK